MYMYMHICHALTRVLHRCEALGTLLDAVMVERSTILARLPHQELTAVLAALLDRRTHLITRRTLPKVTAVVPSSAAGVTR